MSGARPVSDAAPANAVPGRGRRGARSAAGAEGGGAAPYLLGACLLLLLLTAGLGLAEAARAAACKTWLLRATVAATEGAAALAATDAAEAHRIFHRLLQENMAGLVAVTGAPPYEAALHLRPAVTDDPPSARGQPAPTAVGEVRLRLPLLYLAHLLPAVPVTAVHAAAVR
jgi:hypothetical protein